MSVFLSDGAIRRALAQLSHVHPFFGTSYLVLHRNQVPVGRAVHLSLDNENRQHLKKYFRLHPRSDYFFTPFKKASTEGFWRKPKYASTTLQAINTQAFASALVHPTKSEWGWSADYLDVLSAKLSRHQRLPLVAFAIWFGKENSWPDHSEVADLASQLIHEFQIPAEDLERLFEPSCDWLVREELFSPSPLRWQRTIESFELPPDVQPETGALLQYISIAGVGPSKRLELHAGSRLNLITGDNGLGKTFLLDAIWWVLTGTWAESPIRPFEPPATPPLIRFQVGTVTQPRPLEAKYNLRNSSWDRPSRSAQPGLAIYARVDGSFAVFDPARRSRITVPESSASLVLSRKDLWEGSARGGTEGLLRDWVRWQTRKEEFVEFAMLERVLSRLMPTDLGRVEVSTPVRVPDYTMEIPRLRHPYGDVPVLFESAGIRRILSLAYLIVWAWSEHRQLARQAGVREESQLLIMIDEAEAHLHPRWQRTLLPALLGIGEDLTPSLSVQYFIASHSPLVLASAEPVWQSDRDSLFHLEISHSGAVTFGAVPFELRGSADSWLLSPAFDVHPGSQQAESALTKAKRLMAASSPSINEVKAVGSALADALAAEDPFWLRWVPFATKIGWKP